MLVKKVSIVLVEPENPDNIGAVCRAIKNTGFQDLRLVKPPSGWKAKGRKLAMNAKDILASAKTYSSFETAIRDSHFIIGTSRRKGAKRGTFIPFFDALEKIRVLSAKKKKITLVFGKESKGLDTKTLKQCHAVTSFPVSPKYPSYNLAQAVLAFLFSLAYPSIKEKEELGPETFSVPRSEIEKIMSRLEEVLVKLDYVRAGANKLGRILDTFHRLIKRNGMKQDEAQMFMGLTRRLLEKLPA